MPSQGSSLRGLRDGWPSSGFRGVQKAFLIAVFLSGNVEVCVSLEKDLYEFILKVWPKAHGDSDSLASWISRARLAFPDVNLLEDARKASVWEAEKASNGKKSARRFLRNWWARSQESSSPVAPVVSLSAVRWLSKNNKHPDFLFESWARGKVVDERAVLEFCGYIGVTRPDDPEEVVSVFLRGV